MEFGNLAAWFAVAVAAGALVYTMVTNRSKALAHKMTALDGRVERIAERIDRIEDRTTVIEGDMRHLPDKDTTQELRVAIEQMNGQVQLLGERIRPIAAISDRLQEHLIGNLKP